MTALSVVIITYNEAANIGRCLESVKQVADEIVVVDSFSTDDTRAICESYAVRFVSRAFAGHVEQKNFAVAQASYTHILSIDADECLSPELRDSILAIKTAWQKDGYLINRLTSFCGSWVRHSGWYPDRKLRLFDRTRGRFAGINPHDRFEMFSGATTGRIDGDLLHFTAESVQAYKSKLQRYAGIAAADMFRNGKSISILMLYVKTASSFLKHYFLQLGFLDGAIGWKICVMSAGYTYHKYRLLLQHRKPHGS